MVPRPGNLSYAAQREAAENLLEARSSSLPPRHEVLTGSRQIRPEARSYIVHKAGLPPLLLLPGVGDSKPWRLPVGGDVFLRLR